MQTNEIHPTPEAPMPAIRNIPEGGQYLHPTIIGLAGAMTSDSTNYVLKRAESCVIAGRFGDAQSYLHDGLRWANTTCTLDSTMRAFEQDILAAAIGRVQEHQRLTQ